MDLFVLVVQRRGQVKVAQHIGGCLARLRITPMGPQMDL